MVDPFTTMMSSLPSLSQSIRPTPPLIDSTMYCLSGVEMWGTVSPASRETSLKRGNCAHRGREKTETKSRSLRITAECSHYREKNHDHQGTGLCRSLASWAVLQRRRIVRISRRGKFVCLLLLSLVATPFLFAGDSIPQAAWKRGIGQPLENPGGRKPALASSGMIDDGYWQGAPVGGFGAGTFSRTYRGDFSRWHIKSGVHKYQTVWTNQFAMFL